MSIFLFSLYFIIKNMSANSKIFDFYFLLVEYWNITYIFTLILSTMKRKIENEQQFCFSDNVAVCDMSKFFCFRRKSKNWIWKTAIHVQSFFFSAKTLQSFTELPKREGEVFILTVIFSSLAPSPQIHFPPCAERFFLACPPPPPPLLRYTSLERRKRKIRVYRVVTSPNMNGFSAEYIKDLVITQRKTQSEVSLFLKERFPSKKDLSSKSVRRFCFENGINLHNRLSNDELEQCTRDVVARLSLSLLDLSACCSLFSSFFYLHLLVCIAVYMSALQGSKWFSAFSVNLEAFVKAHFFPGCQ